MKLGRNAILLIVLGALALYAITFYNGTISAEEGVKGQWAKVESAYQMRADKSKNLEAIVTNAADFERETLTEVIEARSKASSIQINADNLTPENIAAFQQAQEQFSGSLGRLLATIERYPELKAMGLYGDFMAEYSGMENRIKTERDRFNEAAKGYNTRIKRFPGNMLAGIFGFEEKGYFAADAGAEKAPELFKDR
jgi:LemA protein